MISKKVYIVEDMAIARAALIDTLSDNNYVIAGSAANAEKAWEEISILEVDIVLLDINLIGEKDGIWLAEKIRAEHCLPIVFLTAYGDQNTLSKITQLKPNGYLMKPYNEPTLLTTLMIAFKSFEATNKNTLDNNSYIFIKEKGLQVKIELHKIMFIKSEGNYLDLHLTDTKYTIREKLQTFLEKLNVNFIKQVHQRYAVNINFVEAISNSKIILKDKNIPISRSHKDSISNLFN